MKCEENYKINYLDFCLKQEGGTMERRIRHNTTQSDQYLNFNTLCRINYKRGLVWTLYQKPDWLCFQER
ncbi:unnamed protein product, partial [Heterobilharzia americana]